MNMEYMDKAQEKIENTPMLVNLISYRTRQLNAGARPMLPLLARISALNWALTTDAWVGFDNVRLDAIPEPATLGMVALFGGGIIFIRRNRML